MLLILWLPRLTFAGGSGLNVLVVVNPNSPNSLALGNYYCERRHVPPQNVVRLENWAGSNIVWTRGQLQRALLAPLLTRLSERGLARQIDFVLLSMDIPYKVTEADSVNSTTAVLYYGFKPYTAFPFALPRFSSNSYAFSEAVFRDLPPDTAPTNTFLALMLTASNLAQAKLIVDNGVDSDGTLPLAPVYLAKTSDPKRSVRCGLFDDAIFDNQAQGHANLIRTNQDSPYGLTGLLGYQAGSAPQFSLLPNTFVPGAMADSFTSFGGLIFQPNDQTTLLAFLVAGATGSYGTIVEPGVALEKFPSPRNYFYQTRGFSLAESYYQSLSIPFQGLMVGEPLAAPFAQPAIGSWSRLMSGAVLHGMTNLDLEFAASHANLPIQQVDLFVDGTLLQTITNIAPAQSNLLSVAMDGATAEYLVPAKATLRSVAAGLAQSINSASNLTQVTASVVGDRIALRSANPYKAGEQVSITVRASGPSGRPTTFVTASRSNFLDSFVLPLRSFDLPYAELLPGDNLNLEVKKANGERVALSATNVDISGSPAALARNLADQVNSNALLTSLSGVSAEVTAPTNPALSSCTLSLRAREPGLSQSLIQVLLSSSSPNFRFPAVTNQLDFNLSDTQPRNHLFIGAGVTNLALAFQLDTKALPDGYHELTAVAYEGSHVRTQARITMAVVVSNSPLAASFVAVTGDSQWAVEGTLAFSVSANTNAVAAIELFSTGGSLGVIRNQTSANFSVSGAFLGAGLHPFYSVVTLTNGAQYRSETKWIRLVGEESPFPLAITGSPPLLSWPAIGGRRYEILSADHLPAGFQLRQSLMLTNELGRWIEPADRIGSNLFYRVRSSQAHQ